MSEGHIVDPLSAEWLKTISFGDVLKLLVLTVGFVVGYVHLTDRVSSVESDLARAVAEMSDTQKDSRSTWEQRFTDMAQRDNAERAELSHQIERLADRIDGITPQHNRP